MADGAPNRTFILTLDATLASEFEKTAREAGSDAEGFLFDIVVDTLAHRHLGDLRTDAARKWQDEQAAIALGEYDRTGEYITLEDWSAELKADIRRRLDAKS